jgi:hypothetical protein
VKRYRSGDEQQSCSWPDGALFEVERIIFLCGIVHKSVGGVELEENLVSEYNGDIRGMFDDGTICLIECRAPDGTHTL